jgi:hypothetical protein
VVDFNIRASKQLARHPFLPGSRQNLGAVKQVIVGTRAPVQSTVVGCPEYFSSGDNGYDLLAIAHFACIALGNLPFTKYSPREGEKFYRIRRPFYSVPCVGIAAPEPDRGSEYNQAPIVFFVSFSLYEFVTALEGFPKDASENLCFSLLVKQSLPRRE